MSKEFVTIAVFEESHEAHIFRSKLESEGIPAFIANEITGDIKYVGSHGGLTVKLNVPKENTQDALRIYNEIRPYELDDQGNLRECSSCGEKKILVAPIGRNVFFKLFPFFEKKRFICNACKTIF